MLKVKVIAIGRNKEAWLTTVLSEYEHRLKGKVQFEWIFVEDNAALASLCKKEAKFIALDIQGELLDSETFCKKWINYGARSTFVIGGPTGLPKEILDHAHWRFSLSPLTFTHQIVRCLLIEQIYRAWEITRGSPYHK